PDGLTEIESAAFSGCEQLGDFTFPDSLKNIGSSAFSECDSLTKIVIPEGTEFVGSGVFYGCKNLADVQFPGSIRVESNPFEDTAWCRALQENDPLVIVSGILLDGSGCTGDVIIPEGVTKICANAFSENKDITAVTIPDSTVFIGELAFYRCDGLTSVKTGNGLAEIQPNTFCGCSNLKEVVLGNSVETIGEFAFSHCTSLETVSLNDSLKCIEPYAFYEDVSLKAITVPDGVTHIREWAFAMCESLKDVEIGSDMQEIGPCAFRQTAIEEITIPQSVTLIDNYAFYGCDKMQEITIENPNCMISVENIYDTIPHNDGNTTIHSYNGSFAQQFAEEHGFPFASLGESPDAIRGDMDGNGKITVADAVLLARFVNEDDTLNDAQRLGLLNADPDLDSDGFVTVMDVRALLKMLETA
ncbi:MAG: leucine-rich repeat protein, partial [Oscillospiraceae bacterium]|nr:leucine-rich repeat protein [Oscillospiraceae bacterium]